MKVIDNVKTVDLMEQGRPYRTSGYLVLAERPAIIEAGGVPSVPIWLKALEEHDVPASEIAYVFITHVHLDHGGGTGTLLRHLPKAQVIAHPRGARHLVDPSRLIAGARYVFGDKLEEMWGIPEPVPEDRVVVGEPGTLIDLGGGHKMKIFDAPGHAAHQYMLLDEGTGALFSADELGVRYPTIETDPDYVLPVTSPNQFNPDGMLQSVSLTESIRPETIFLSHFGQLQCHWEILIETLRKHIPVYTGYGDPSKGAPDASTIKNRLEDYVRADLDSRGVDWSEDVERVLRSDLWLSAMGIEDYWRRQSQPARS